MQIKKSFRRYKDSRVEHNLTKQSNYVINVWKQNETVQGLGENLTDQNNWKWVEPVRLKEKGIVHKHCILVDKVFHGGMDELLWNHNT